MKLRSILFVCAALTVWPALCSAATLSLVDGRITCELTDSLRPLPDEELSRFLLKPLAAYSTTARDARITVTRGVHPQPMNVSDLLEVKRVMKSGFEKMFPGANWRSDELIEVNGRKWIHFELTMEVKEKQIRSALYVTSFDGDQLQFLLQADGPSGAQSWATLEECGHTLRIR